MSSAIQYDFLDYPELNERIYFENDVKIYQTKAILSYLNSPFLEFSRNTRYLILNPIPVHNDDGKEIGFADVFLINNRLVANISLDYATPERLASETKEGLQYYPHVKGILELEEEMEWRLDLYGKRKKVLGLEILSIKLLPYPTEDPRLDSLGKPILV